MKPKNANIAPDSSSAPQRHKEKRRALKWIFGSLGGLIILIAAALCAVTLYLTPANLTRLINKYAGDYFRAEIRVTNADFTIWSTFPHFRIELDSLTIVSRTLCGVDSKIRAKLPADADSLASATSLRGGINILDLMSGRISLRDVELEGLSLNLAAYNDSINNYDILLPSDSMTREVPYLTANRISLRKAGTMRYYSAATQAALAVKLSSLRMKRISRRNDSYVLDIGGTFSASIRKLPIFRRFPFTFGGNMRLAFRPFRLRLYDYGINLGNMRSRLNLNLNLESGSVSRMQYEVDPFSLTGLLGYLPKRFLPGLNHIRSDMMLEISARLTEPYHYSSTRLPSFSIDFHVPDSRISYSASNGRIFAISRFGLDASLDFSGSNPANSRVNIPRICLKGEGISLAASATVTDLLADPSILVKAVGSADCSRAAAMITDLPGGIAIKGKAGIDARLTCRLSDLQKADFAAMKTSGKVALRDFSFSYPAANISLSGKTALFSFSDEVDNPGAKRGELTAHMNLDKAAFSTDGFNISAKRISLDASTPVTSLSGAIRNNSPLSINASAGAQKTRIKLISGKGSAEIHGLGTKARFTAGNRSGLQHCDLKVTASRAAWNGAETRATLVGLGISASLLPRQTTDSAATGLRKFLSEWKLNGTLNMSEASLLTPHYPARTTLSNLNLSLAPDSLHISSLGLRSQDQFLSLTGSVTGLRRVLTTGMKEPLKLRLALKMDTLNINQLAKSLEVGKLFRARKSARAAGRPVPTKIVIVRDTLAASDTVPLLLPRNIDADIAVDISEIQYSNLRYFDTGTRATLRDGMLHIDSLHTATGFGRAFADIDYYGRDCNDMAVKARINVQQINVVRFFTNFGNLLEMMPEMKNLSGNISADVEGSMEIFPNMFINVPSLQAAVQVNGWDLQVRQNSFIRKITKMLLIRNSNDIHIPAMSVRASVHDDLLQLYPFIFEFDRYRLRMMGVNDFDGHLWYHIGVLRSPVPFRFGINIRGLFHDPELRFGGTGFNVDRARSRMTINYHRNINLIQELKYYLDSFIHKAGSSEVMPSPFSRPEALQSDPDTTKTNDN